VNCNYIFLFSIKLYISGFDSPLPHELDEAFGDQWRGLENDQLTMRRGIENEDKKQNEKLTGNGVNGSSDNELGNDDNGDLERPAGCPSVVIGLFPAGERGEVGRDEDGKLKQESGIVPSMSMQNIQENQKALVIELMTSEHLGGVKMYRWRSRYGISHSPYIFCSKLQESHLLHRHVSVAALVKPLSKRLFISQSLIQHLITGEVSLLVAILCRKCFGSASEFCVSPIGKEDITRIISIEKMEKMYIHLTTSGLPGWSLSAYHRIMEQHRYFPCTQEGVKSDTFHFEGSGKYTEPDSTEPGVSALN
jgi:hypothetical protein